MIRDINPFNITTADDFSDQQINDFWLDITDGRGYFALVKPTSPMPMFLLGGKGSGKTHLLRYLSSHLQTIRHHASAIDGIAREGFIGVYLQCSGLNANRFKGKNQTDDDWNSIFAYYMELWLGQLVLGTFDASLRENHEFKAVEKTVVRDLLDLFDTPPSVESMTVSGIVNELSQMQKRVDLAINNCGLGNALKVEIAITRGKLIFGAPRVVLKHFKLWRSVQCLYLLDEFENLSLSQQVYVNTLIRERLAPTSFKIGARMYGVRTHSTYCADEDNKEGSEFEVLRLDSKLRSNGKSYRAFARKLIATRLAAVGNTAATAFDGDELRNSLSRWFEGIPPSRFAERDTAFVVSKYSGRERPYFQNLQAKLLHGLSLGATPGITRDETIARLIDILRFPTYPLLEKANVFLLYRGWSKGKELPALAKMIAMASARHVQSGGKQKGAYKRLLHHFKADLIAQILRECEQKQRYYGIDPYIDMSWGLPRNLLNILKAVFTWSSFLEEGPFVDGPISTRAQHAGIKEATEWFFNDARTVGGDAVVVQTAIKRLGILFRAIRFADKPSECSCTAFSADLTAVTDEARRVIDLAQKWSLLIDVGIQRDRNSDRIDSKFQLNRMLAPLWDLAIYRRGVIALSAGEVNTIFGIKEPQGFDAMLSARIERMTAPLFGGWGRKDQSQLLPGFSDDD